MKKKDYLKAYLKGLIEKYGNMKAKRVAELEKTPTQSIPMY